MAQLIERAREPDCDFGIQRIKEMETSYERIIFHSRLAARWAVFFDEMNIEYDYRPVQRHSSDIQIPAHFYLPEQNNWIMVQGSIEDGEVVDEGEFESEAYHMSKLLNDREILVFYGQIPTFDNGVPDYGNGIRLCAQAVFNGPEDIGGGGMSDGHDWCECPKCGKLDVIWAGTVGRLTCCENSPKERNRDSSRLVAAYKAAREFKFT